MLLYPAVLQSTLPHSHSIVPGGFEVTYDARRDVAEEGHVEGIIRAADRGCLLTSYPELEYIAMARTLSKARSRSTGWARPRGTFSASPSRSRTRWATRWAWRSSEASIPAKPWKGQGSGVFEVVEDHHGNTYRAVYTVRFKEVVYVLHAFQKKSPRGSRRRRSTSAWSSDG